LAEEWTLACPFVGQVIAASVAERAAIMDRR
jgi:hypothetical protein